MFRGALILSVLTTAVPSVGSASAGDPVITVAPLRGAGGAKCAARLADVLSDSVSIEPWDDPRGVTGFESFSALSRFIEARGRALGADIVVVGTSRKKKLILEAYDVRRGALLNITKVPMSESLSPCTIGRKGRRLVLAFADRAEQAFVRRRARRAAAAETEKPGPARRRREDYARGAAAAESRSDEPDAATVTASVSAPVASAPLKASPDREAPVSPGETLMPEPDDLDLVRTEGVLRDTSASTPVSTASAAAPLGTSRRPRGLVEVEPEIGLAQRTLTFSDPNGATVATYQIGAMFAPGLRARARPFGASEGLLAPLEVELSFHQSPTFSSRRVSQGPQVDTRFVEGTGLVRYPIKIPRSRFSASPELGAQLMQYSLRGTAAGAGSLETPSASYRSLILGLGLEAPIVEQADVRLGAAYMPVLSAGQIFADNYYPDGSAWALRVEATLTVYVMRWLVVVVTGHYTGYDIDLKGTREAQPASASDRTTGLRLGLRISL